MYSNIIWIQSLPIWQEGKIREGGVSTVEHSRPTVIKAHVLNKVFRVRQIFRVTSRRQLLFETKITMLKLQQVLVLTLAMGLLLQCCSVDARHKSKSKSESSSEVSEGNGAATPSVNVVDLVNFINTGFFDLVLGVLGAVALCIPMCTDVASCIGCFVVNLPPPPVIPDGLIPNVTVPATAG